MKTIGRTLTTLATACLAIALIGCGSETEESGLVEDLGTLMPAEPEVPQTAQNAPDNVDILFADDLLHVSKITLRPGESLPELEASHHLYYRAGGLEQVEIQRDGEMVAADDAAGDVRYVPSGTVTITNTGSEPIEVIEVARTDTLLPEFLDRDAGSATAGDQLFDNDLVRVNQLTLDAGASTELVRVPIRLVYSPDASLLRYETADGDSVQVPTDVSAAYSRPGDDVSVANPGDESTTVVVFDWFV